MFYMRRKRAFMEELHKSNIDKCLNCKENHTFTAKVSQNKKEKSIEETDTNLDQTKRGIIITDQEIRTKEETAIADPVKETINVATAETGK